MQNRFQQVIRSLPKEPLLEENLARDELSRWEAVLAYNIAPPGREKQDFWWLEILASSPHSAEEVAWQWVQRNPDKQFECTGWVRPASEHRALVQIEDDPHPISILWQIPLPENWPLGKPIRHPATGIRIGFRDPRGLEEFSIHPPLGGDFVPVRHLPSSGADLVCLLPLVYDLSR